MMPLMVGRDLADLFTRESSGCATRSRWSSIGLTTDKVQRLSA